MKLNKLERHTAYIILLAEYENDERLNRVTSQGFCWQIKELFTNQTDEDNWDRNVYWFKELVAKKPIDCFYGGSWFSVCKEGRIKRIDILKQCIEETY